jgi:hypothetical protein
MKLVTRLRPNKELQNHAVGGRNENSPALWRVVQPEPVDKLGNSLCTG